MQPLKAAILFYRQNAPYGFMSNFYPSPMEQAGKIYPTNEHYFQSKKFLGHKYQDLIIEAKSPMEAATLGRSRDFPLREDWQKVKDKIMYDGLKLKFNQNQHLKEQLLATDDAKLVEHTSNDSYWADGKNGKGKNMLGVLLMQLRQEYKK